MQLYFAFLHFGIAFVPFKLTFFASRLHCHARKAPHSKARARHRKTYCKFRAEKLLKDSPNVPINPPPP
jgi:hypothetical protein